MATIEEQKTTIQTTEFYNALRAKLQAVNAVLAENELSVDGKITVHVSAVPVAMAAPRRGDADIDLDVGDNGSGKPLYQWHIPIAWVI